MQTPLELVFRGVEPPDETKVLVAEKAEQLETLYDGTAGCHVYIRPPHQSQRTGDLHEITIEVRVPGDEFVVHHDQGDTVEYAYQSASVQDAFAKISQELKRWKHKTRRDTKAHDHPLQGRAVEIHHNEGYGQIIGTDPRRVCFHENSLVDGSFQELQPRGTVELVVQSGESEIGPQASAVQKIGAMSFDPTARPVS